MSPTFLTMESSLSSKDQVVNAEGMASAAQTSPCQSDSAVGAESMLNMNNFVSFLKTTNSSKRTENVYNKKHCDVWDTFFGRTDLNKQELLFIKEITKPKANSKQWNKMEHKERKNYKSAPKKAMNRIYKEKNSKRMAQSRSEASAQAKEPLKEKKRKEMSQSRSEASAQANELLREKNRIRMAQSKSEASAGVKELLKEKNRQQMAQSRSEASAEAKELLKEKNRHRDNFFPVFSAIIHCIQLKLSHVTCIVSFLILLRINQQKTIDTNQPMTLPLMKYFSRVQPESRFHTSFTTIHGLQS